MRSFLRRWPKRDRTTLSKSGSRSSGDYRIDDSVTSAANQRSIQNVPGSPEGHPSQRRTPLHAVGRIRCALRSSWSRQKLLPSGWTVSTTQPRVSGRYSSSGSASHRMQRTPLEWHGELSARTVGGPRVLLGRRKILKSSADRSPTATWFFRDIRTGQQ